MYSSFCQIKPPEKERKYGRDIHSLHQGRNCRIFSNNYVVFVEIEMWLIFQMKLMVGLKLMNTRSGSMYRLSKKVPSRYLLLKWRSLNDSKLIPNDQGGHSDWFEINVESIRTFHKQITGWELYLEAWHVHTTGCNLHI